jgi:hypothetical protein
VLSRNFSLEPGEALSVWRQDYRLDDQGIVGLFLTGSGIHRVSYPMGVWSCFPRHSGQGVTLTTHFRVVPRLGMRGAILPLLRPSLHVVYLSTASEYFCRIVVL